MTEIKRMYEVWDGMGTCRLTTDDYDAAWNLKEALNREDVWAKVHNKSYWDCARCGKLVTCNDRDATCWNCHAEYNASGDRLLDNWRDNPSWRYGDVGDLEGAEIAALRREGSL